jgi:hypothetical protein
MPLPFLQINAADDVFAVEETIVVGAPDVPTARVAFSAFR